MRLLVSIALSLALTAHVAAAEPDPAPDAKSPEVALGLSIGTTLVGYGMIALDLRNPDPGGLSIGGGVLVVLGPTTGHWYSGDVLTYGLAARVFGAGLLYAGTPVPLLGCEAKDTACGSVALAAVGGVLFLGGSILDMATAPRAAREWNEAHDVQLEPTALSTAHGIVPGLALTGRF